MLFNLPADLRTIIWRKARYLAPCDGQRLSGRPATADMSAFLVDPFEKRLQRIPCADESGPEDPELLAIAVTEGARGQDFVTCARVLMGGADAFAVNPYTLWENNQGRAVLFVGSRTAQDHHGFRLGKPGKAVKSTVFYGKGVLLRYERIRAGIHRTELLRGGASLSLPP